MCFRFGREKWIAIFFRAVVRESSGKTEFDEVQETRISIFNAPLAGVYWAARVRVWEVHLTLMIP
ncbi:MAG: hypothetical protein CSA52_01110 [Gammaproteobacteria bacterium]|nr:MAG: hypothetical protein CSB48_13020 [Pseudomonadota bacterium]PIE38780.1 MAG: hypothetical protein CSA52_01110 [Gammaproteobacteria bacterium]